MNRTVYISHISVTANLSLNQSDSLLQKKIMISKIKWTILQIQNQRKQTKIYNIYSTNLSGNVQMS